MWTANSKADKSFILDRTYFFLDSDEFPPLGVEKELVSDAQMSASSMSDPLNASASNGRLNFNNAWCSATSNEEPLFLQVDLNEMHIITGVSVSPIGHVRYINILTWLRGFRVKIANFSSFFCLSIPKRDLDRKKTTPNIEVCPESLWAMLEYWYIERGPLKRIYFIVLDCRKLLFFCWFVCTILFVCLLLSCSHAFLVIIQFQHDIFNTFY